MRSVTRPDHGLRCSQENSVSWTAIQAAADRYNVITDELFQLAFASHTTVHSDRILIACAANGERVGTAAAWLGEGNGRRWAACTGLPSPPSIRAEGSVTHSSRTRCRD